MFLGKQRIGGGKEKKKLNSFLYFLNWLFLVSRYQSVHKLLKILIRRARSCCHLRLLDKHCAVPSLDQNAIKSSSCLFKVSSIFGISERPIVLLDACSYKTEA